MKFYDDDNEEDSFSEDEIALANRFCDACDKGISMVLDEEEYDIIISNLMFSQKSDYLKKAIERAQQDYPEDPEFVIWKMRYLIWNDQQREAQIYMQRILRHFPPYAELYEEMAFIAYTFHLNMNVRELVLKAIAIEPSSNAYFILTNLYLDQHNVEKAVDCFQEAYKYDNMVLDNVDLLILSNRNNKSDRFEAELSFMTALSREFPLNSNIWMLSGTLNAIGGQHANALQAFEFAVAIEPTSIGYYHIAGQYYMLQNYDKTVELCWLIHSKNELNPRVLLGRAFRMLGFYDEALFQLNQTNEKDPEYPYAFSEIIDVLKDSGQLDKVPAFIHRFYDSQNLSLEKLETVLDCLRSDMQDEAFYQLSNAAESQFDSATDYCAWLTDFCYLVHCQDIALRILEERFTDLPDPELYKHLGYFLALLNIANGNHKAAIQHLQNAITINENGIKQDFLDIDTDLLYTQNPEIFMLVSPYTDYRPNIHNN